MILKVQTENAESAEIFSYQDGKRKSLERISIQEVRELSQADRLQMFTGNEVAALADPQLIADLEICSYYVIQPLII
jgi:hypothetical protein